MNITIAVRFVPVLPHGIFYAHANSDSYKYDESRPFNTEFMTKCENKDAAITHIKKMILSSIPDAKFSLKDHTLLF